MQKRKDGFNKMNILAVCGSHRKNGNTAAVLDLFREAFQTEASSEGLELSFRTIFLCDFDIQPCRGCRLCFDRGENACPLKDDILRLHGEIISSDCVVLATPVYVNDVSSTMKTLIDRLAFVCHRPAYFNTPFYLVATTGGSPIKHTIRTLQSAVVSWGAHPIGSQGFSLGALTSIEKIKIQNGTRIAHSARQTVRSLANKKHAKPSFISLIVFAIQQSSWKKIFLEEDKQESVDARYWREHGWLDRNCRFFFNSNSSPLKTIPARIIGKIVAQFFT